MVDLHDHLLPTNSAGYDAPEWILIVKYFSTLFHKPLD
jgi:hypothetical protein